MTYLVVENVAASLNRCVEILREICPDDDIASFDKPLEAAEWAKTNKADTAILDIEMPGMSGLELAVELKRLNPFVKILFCTAFSQYAMDAFRVHAGGYVMKPISAEKLREELEALNFIRMPPSGRLAVVKTFGAFEVLVKGKPVAFSRSKSKEALAYLVNSRGAGVTSAELASVMWEDGMYDRSRQKQMQNIMSDLRKSLAAVGAEKMLVKTSDGYAVDPGEFDCDFYRLLDGDYAAINAYFGEYMRNYSWAEMTAGMLSQKTGQQDKK